MSAFPFLFALGSGLKVANDFSQAAAAKRVAAQNADIANQRAMDELQAANAQADLLKTKRQSQIDQAKVAFAASGVESAGSPLEVLNNLASIAEREVAAVRKEGMNKSAFYSLEAQQERDQGKRLFNASIFSGLSTILTAPMQLNNLNRYKDETALSGADSGTY